MTRAVAYQTISSLSKGYKRSTTKMYRTYTRRVPEYGWMDNIPDEEITPDPSGRENLIPLDVAPGYGAAMIEDGGWESRTETPALVEGSFVYTHCNSRFSISLRAQAFDKKARGGQIIRQIKYQSLKCVESVMRKFGQMYYGTTVGTLALVATTQSAGLTATIPLKDAFGVAELDNTTYLASMFVVGDGVALVRTGAIVANAFGVVTGSTASGLAVDFGTYNGGNNITPTAGDLIVSANILNDFALTGTDYGKWNVGLLDIFNSDSVHGQATSTQPTWAPALWDKTTGGGFGFVKIKKIRQALENSGDTTLRRIVYSNGVENDMQARERGGLIYSNSGQMNLDANVTAKGVSFDTTRFTPPTCALGIGADAMGKSVLTDKVDEEELIDFGRLFKAEDRSALKGGVDIVSANICRSRSRFAGYANLDEQ